MADFAKALAAAREALALGDNPSLEDSPLCIQLEQCMALRKLVAAIDDQSIQFHCNEFRHLTAEEIRNINAGLNAHDFRVTSLACKRI